MKAFQEYYTDDFSHCFGCGTKNKNGHQLKTYWEGELTISVFRPRPEHTAVPGFVYGGLIASLIDCHSTASGSAALFNTDDKKEKYYPRCVTARLCVDYLKPTPIESELKLIGKINEIKGRKVIVKTELYADNEKCAEGEAIVIKINESFIGK